MADWSVWELDTPYVLAHGAVIVTIDALKVCNIETECPRGSTRPGSVTLWLAPVETVGGVRNEPPVPGLQFIVQDLESTIPDEFTAYTDLETGRTAMQQEAWWYAYLYQTGRIPPGHVEDYGGA